MRYTVFLWVLTVMGTLAAVYGGALAVKDDPFRPPITLQAVVSKLKALDREGRTPHSVEGIRVFYKREGEKDRVREQVEISLEEARGSVILEFFGGVIQRVAVADMEYRENAIPRAIRGDLGTVLRISRLLA